MVASRLRRASVTGAQDGDSASPPKRARVGGDTPDPLKDVRMEEAHPPHVRLRAFDLI